MNYQGIGSSGGIKQIIAKTVDFAGSDAPLKDDELEKDGLFQFPTVVGGVVPVVNLPGIKPGDLKLTGEVLANIYLGKVGEGTTVSRSAHSGCCRICGVGVRKTEPYGLYRDEKLDGGRCTTQN